MSCWRRFSLLLGLVAGGCLGGERIGEHERVPAAPDAADFELCQAFAEPLEVTSCARRFACSRRMWRADVVAPVYECIRSTGPEEDAAFACLHEVAGELPPSAAQQRFEAALSEAEGQCGALLDVAPGQSDAVYDLLTPCLGDNDECDAKASCALLSLETAVDAICG